ncbi:MAG: hypothetical protein ACP5RH_19965, partial [Leptodesmis sp.]|uniref:Tc toxin subunit A-related protein n=1 Tax=Leptodesmis sp. TaxID=3100501 RepID=UPI003D0E3885
ARLLADIYKLDQYRLETEQRKLQLTKVISLARTAPFEFQRFKETGVLVFATPIEGCDRDFPGHYLRLIKRVRTSVIALIPPTEGIKATLTSIGISRVVVNNDGLFQPRFANRSPESVALTSPTNATGLFELEPQSEMLLPFEGLGVDTTWEFRLPEDFPPNLDSLKIQQVPLYFARRNGETFEITANLTFQPNGEAVGLGGETETVDGIISTRRGNAGSWMLLVGQSPFGEKCDRAKLTLPLPLTP